MNYTRTGLALTATLALVCSARAEEWPTRPVRIISTFAAGGTADILARIVANDLSAAFKQQFYVEVRAGAGGQIGVRSVIESPPDGYSLAIVNVSHLVLHPVTREDAHYDPSKDLTNIAFIGGSPVVFAVNSEKSGIRTFKQFVERGKKETLTYSSSGLGTMTHLVAANFSEIAKIKAEHVPYKGASQGLNDLMGGHITMSSQTVSSTAAMMRGGTLTGLSVSAEERLPDWPDLPTFKEQGYPQLVASVWFGLAGPANMPPKLVNRINEEVIRGLKEPNTAARMRQDGLIVNPMTPKQYSQFIASENKFWRPVIDQVGLAVNKSNKKTDK